MKRIALAASLLATPLFAGEFEGDFVLSTYTAYISMNDLTNSSGASLDSAVDVIRQDRANLFRFGQGDSSDEEDFLFVDPAERARIPDMIAYSGGISPDVERRIMRGNVQVYVDIISNGGQTIDGLVISTLE